MHDEPQSVGEPAWDSGETPEKAELEVLRILGDRCRNLFRVPGMTAVLGIANQLSTAHRLAGDCACPGRSFTGSHNMIQP